MGQSIHSGDREFRVPEHYPLEAAGCRVDGNGIRYIRVKGVRWFTNMDYPKRHEPMTLYKRYKGHEDEFPRYDNYDAIEISKTADIPFDYDGVMGVPITYLDKHCYTQFAILGMTQRDNIWGLQTKVYTPKDSPKYGDMNRRSIIKDGDNYILLYARLLIQRRQDFYDV